LLVHSPLTACSFSFSHSHFTFIFLRYTKKKIKEKVPLSDFGTEKKHKILMIFGTEITGRYFRKIKVETFIFLKYTYFIPVP
jgi:hypothetical protein